MATFKGYGKSTGYKATKADLGPMKSSKSKALKKKIPAHYRGNTNSEGGIPFGRAPKGEK